MMGGMGSFGIGGMGFGWIISLLFIGLLVWGIVKIVNNNKEDNNSQSSKTIESTLDIIKKRYAQGEITSEQFNKMKNELS